MLFYWGQLGMAESAAGLIALKQPVNGVFNAVIAAIVLMAIRFYSTDASTAESHHGNLSSIVFNVLLMMTIVAGATPVVIDSYTLRDDEERHVARQLTNSGQWIATEITISAPTAEAFAADASDLRQTMSHIAKGAPGSNVINFALIDADGATLGGRGEIASLGGNGSIGETESGLTIWQPAGDMPSMVRWRKSRYVHEVNLYGGPDSPRVVVEYSAASIVEHVDSERLKLLAALAAIMTLALAASVLLSQWLTKPIRNLSAISRTLIDEVISESAGGLPFPQSRIREYDELSMGLKDMANRLTENFRELRSVKEGLENRVRERTRDIERLSMVASQTVNAVIITDADGRVAWINDGFTRITEFTAEDVLGKRPGDVLQGPETDPETIEIIRAAVAARESFHVEILNYTKSGRPYWLEISCNPMRNEDGEVEGFIAIQTDITERILAEQLKRESESRFRAMFETAPDGMIVIDRRGIITDFNSACETIFGYTTDEIIGENVSLLMPDPYHAEHDAYIRNYIETGHAKIIGIDREVRGRRKDGSTFPMDISVGHSDKGRRQFFVGVIRDITERKMLETSKDEFISTVNHELRTPLTSIKGSLSLALNNAFGELPKTLKDGLDIAHRNADRLIHLVNDILDVQRIQSGTLELDIVRLDLSDLLSSSIAANNGYARQHGVTFSLTDVPRGAVVSGDEHRLMQVLTNLLSNAAKFSPYGSTVQVSARVNGGMARVSVKDDGPGIPEAFQEHIFDRFAQIDSSDTREKGGTGLGLNISKSIMGMHGGAIGLESAGGGGSTFHIDIPLAAGN